MTHPARRTRLYALGGDWTDTVYDSATSDMHPDDFLLYGPHTELGAVIDIGDYRWSQVWSQVSRRKIQRLEMREFLNYLLSWPSLAVPQ
ncbi:hypothetical protein H7J86_24470 [Mycobacterium hackensackense]|uniref:hypothetical protein n=1 Tax=Mycobacterium hackensackense TaxID=228909 RepID=UPI002265CC3D|nr:hypothetical protein [Mycobacterium hackensackense]MCV7255323.1 hypothetical protein [Mycobacterium hackensackense]